MSIIDNKLVDVDGRRWCGWTFWVGFSLFLADLFIHSLTLKRNLLNRWRLWMSDVFLLALHCSTSLNVKAALIIKWTNRNLDRNSSEFFGNRLFLSTFFIYKSFIWLNFIVKLFHAVFKFKISFNHHPSACFPVRITKSSIKSTLILRHLVMELVNKATHTHTQWHFILFLNGVVPWKAGKERTNHCVQRPSIAK